MIVGSIFFFFLSIVYGVLSIYMKKKSKQDEMYKYEKEGLIMTAKIFALICFILALILIYLKFFRQVKTRSVLADASAFTDLFYIFKIHLYFRLKNKLFLCEFYIHLKINSNLTLRFLFSSVPKITPSPKGTLFFISNNLI